MFAHKIITMPLSPSTLKITTNSDAMPRAVEFKTPEPKRAVTPDAPKKSMPDSNMFAHKIINMPLSSTHKITTNFHNEQESVEFKTPEPKVTPDAPKKRPREELEQEIQLLRQQLNKKKKKRSPPLERLYDFVCNDYEQELKQWQLKKQDKPNKKAVRPNGIRIRAFLKRSFVTKQRINEFKAFGTILNGASNQRSMSTICEETNMPINVVAFLEQMKQHHQQACQLRQQLEQARKDFETAYDNFSHAVQEIRNDNQEN